MSKEQEQALMPAPPKMVAAPRSFSLLPTTLGEAMEIARLIADSDFAPKGYEGKAGNVLIAIQMGADVGLKPMQALQNIAVINGRPSIWGDAALALAMPALEKFSETISGEGDKRTATCTLRRRGWPDDVVRTFSIEDAKRAGLWDKKGPWQTYPDRMLQMRARGFAIRDGAPDCLMGLILAEEAMDSHEGALDATVVAVEEAADPIEWVPEGLRDRIEKAFETLSMSKAQRLVKLNEFKPKEDQTADDRAEALVNWLRDEYSKRKTGKPAAPPKTDNSKKPEPEVKEGTVVEAPQEQPKPEEKQEPKPDAKAETRKAPPSATKKGEYF